MTLNIQNLSKTTSISSCARKRSSADVTGINKSVPSIGGTGNGLDNARANHNLPTACSLEVAAPMQLFKELSTESVMARCSHAFKHRLLTPRTSVICQAPMLLVRRRMVAFG